MSFDDVGVAGVLVLPRPVGLALRALAQRVPDHARSRRRRDQRDRVAANELARGARAGAQHAERGAGLDPAQCTTGHGVLEGVADLSGQAHRAIGDHVLQRLADLAGKAQCLIVPLRKSGHRRFPCFRHACQCRQAAVDPA
jgi:hypothetical protein